MDLEAIVEEISLAGDVQSAFATLKQTLELQGFDNANYALVTDHPSTGLTSKFGLATNYPDDWVSQYNEHNYTDFDPVWRRLQQKSGYFTWADAALEMRNSAAVSEYASNNCQRLMNEAAESGLVDGIGISFINQFGEVSGIGISRQYSETTPCLDEIAKIILLANILHEKIQSTFKPRLAVSLTTRERDVLSWAMEGKTDGDIALLLGVSHHAVRFHWGNIFRKMQVNSRLLATVKALRERLIQPALIRSTHMLDVTGK